ncbi:hypothetical protein, partial [Vibrio sp. 705]|uniref:hypothetical protein n=1 Tax=Vibrio sp. 705 TaxID=3074611 RepID=UPI0029649AA1
MRLEWGRKALLTAQGSPKGKRLTQSESDQKDTQITHKFESKWVGVGAAERVVSVPISLVREPLNLNFQPSVFNIVRMAKYL